MKYLMNLSFLLFAINSIAGSFNINKDIYENANSIPEIVLAIFPSTHLPPKVDHSQWDRLLKKYVDDKGLVDYKGFTSSSAELNRYLNFLSKNAPDKSWRTEELLAYYINLYNAATVKLIIENYPVQSIKDISRPWSQARISLGHKMVSLDDIEHRILRKMEEPRIHFALNCASISCPKLSNEAYTSEDIYSQLERAAKEFILSDKNDIAPSHPLISSIFDWYRKDFVMGSNMDVIAFINRYSRVKINPDAKISYKKYDWHLNESK